MLLYPEYGYMQEPNFVYIILLCLFAVLIFFLWLIFIYNVVSIYKNWRKIVNRHKFFFLCSLGYFIGYIVAVVIVGNQIKNFKGTNIFLEYFILNSYLLVLVIFWQRAPKNYIEKFESLKGITM